MWGNLTPLAPLPCEGRGESESLLFVKGKGELEFLVPPLFVKGKGELDSPLLVGEGLGERSNNSWRWDYPLYSRWQRLVLQPFGGRVVGRNSDTPLPGKAG
jgi:hypothetical protein